MRNRGIEIYLRELQVANSSLDNDVQLMLRSNYVFKQHSQFEYVLSKLLSLSTLHGFSTLNKLFKLVYSYWTVEVVKKSLGSSSADTRGLQVLDTCFARAISELDLKFDQATMHDDHSGPCGHSSVSRNDVFELTEFYAQKYVFKFKIFELFLQYLSNFFSNSSAPSESSSSSFVQFLNANKTTQFVRVWLMHIPIKHFRSILEFTRLNMEQKLKAKTGFDNLQSIDNLFGFVERRLFGPKGNVNELYKQLLDQLVSGKELEPSCSLELRDAHQIVKKLVTELSQDVHLDLTEESIDLRYSQSLLVRIEKIIDSCSDNKSALVNAKLQLLKKLILVVDWLMFIELSRFKTTFLYSATRLTSTGIVDASSNIDLDEFCNEYYLSLSSLVTHYILHAVDTDTMNIVAYEDCSVKESWTKADYVKLNMFNFEKFFLLTRTLDGGSNTIGLVKIIWMFFYQSCKGLQDQFQLE